MSRRSLPILLVALAVIATGVVWMAGWIGERSPSEISNREAPDRSHESAGSDPTIAPRLAGLSSEASEQPSSVERPDPAPARELAPSNPVDAELAAGIWVQGRVVIPPGTPADEHIEIVAEGAEFDRRGFHRVIPEADGSFRVAFARGTGLGTLRLETRYLYLKSLSALTLPTKREIVLRPLLGGCIRGRILPPVAIRADHAATVGSLVRLSEDAPAKSFSSKPDLYTARVDDELGFFLTGIPALAECSITLDSTVVSLVEPMKISVQPGRESQVDLIVEIWATVSGIVLDRDGRPAVGSKVHWRKSLQTTVQEIHRGDRYGGFQDPVRTDSEGRFRLRLPAGSFSVWSAGDRPIQSLPTDLNVDWGDSIGDLALRMSRGGRLVGRVVDLEGRPRTGVRVMARRAESSGFTMSSEESKTDEQGGFTIEYLVPGKYSIVAFRSDGPRSLLTPLDSADVVVEEDRTAEVLLGARGAESVVVEGTVRRGDEPCAGWTVAAIPRSEARSDVEHAVSDETGRYQIVLDRPGIVGFQLRAPGEHSSIWEDVDVPAVARFEKDFDVGGQGRIAGRVVDARGHGVSGIDVVISPEIPRGGLRGPRFHGERTTDSNGAFRVDGVPPGRFTVQALQGESDGVGAKISGIVLADGASVDDLLLQVVELASLEVTIRRADGKTAPSASVHVSNGTWMSFPRESGPNRYEVEGILPGTVRVEATTADPPLEGSTSLVLAPGAKEKVEIVLHPATTLRVKLTAPGRELSAVEVSLRGERGPYLWPSPPSERDPAEHRFGPLPPGRYEVLATHPDGSSAKAEVVVSGDGEQTVELTLDR